jgi:hypothetical protein
MNIDQARHYALSLPNTTEAPHHKYSSFRIGGKIFATVPPDGLHLHVFVDEEDREHSIALSPSTYQKLFWGDAAVGLRIVLSEAKPAAVQRLLHCAWSRKASRRLAAAHPNPMLP